jgi:hypothetical protein
LAKLGRCKRAEPRAAPGASKHSVDWACVSALLQPRGACKCNVQPADGSDRCSSLFASALCCRATFEKPVSCSAGRRRWHVLSTCTARRCGSVGLNRQPDNGSSAVQQRLTNACCRSFSTSRDHRSNPLTNTKVDRQLQTNQSTTLPRINTFSPHLLRDYVTAGQQQQDSSQSLPQLISSHQATRPRRLAHPPLPTTSALQ